VCEYRSIKCQYKCAIINKSCIPIIFFTIAYILYIAIIYRFPLYFPIVFHNSVHYIHCDARRRNIMLHVPTKSADDYAARDAQDHKVLRR
jgi:hypothetical protein